jgi:adenine-specific DNA-methyltransferase
MPKNNIKNNNSYKGSLGLDWINKDYSLYYEIDEKKGRGIRPVWVPKNDIRVAEPRILNLTKSYGDPSSENMLVKGDNLLVLRSLVEMFKGKKEKDKVRCIYIDPPFNTGQAFEKYDDNLRHSEWLAMMRDRLELLYKLLRKDGSIFIHIDDEELHYLKTICDEIFGRDNFVSTICVRDSHPSGMKTAHKDKTIIKTKSYILVYKISEKTRFNPQYRPKEAWDPHYNYFLDRKKKKLHSLLDVLIRNGFLKKRQSLEDLDLKDQKFRKFYLENRENIIQTTKELPLEVKKKSLERKGEIIIFSNKKGRQLLAFNGRRLASLSESVNNVGFGNQLKEAISLLVCDFWDDIDFNNTQNEGGVRFPASKKPEQLVARVISLASGENDVVLDSFAGSGTTPAVAHKLNRRWISIEIGKHAEDLCITRLKRVISGKDNSGISQLCGWTGGGGFQYYKLGRSVIYDNDMNWEMKAEEMAEAVFLHFQYKIERCDWLKEENMHLGKHRDTPYQFAICFASRKIKILKEELYEKIIGFLAKEKKFKHLTIFTNMPVAVSPESMDDRISIEKIPAKILREYNLI